jgi:putative ABC transport system substrate-binding protein
VERKVDVIVTNGGTATEIANRTSKEIPVVFIWGVTDPVESGLVKSLARPNTNVTGLTNEAGAEIYGKRLELFKEVVPSLRRVVDCAPLTGEKIREFEGGAIGSTSG